MRVAILDDNGVLIGARSKVEPGPDDIDCGDLPADGRYKYQDGQFIPLGFGYGKPKAPSVDRDRAVYLALRALLAGQPIPQECATWCDWYETYNDRAKG